MGRLRAKQDYESLRNARISQNKARLASRGIRRSAEELPSVVSSAKSIAKVRRLKSDSATPLRRSNRLQGIYCDSDSSSPLDPWVDKDHSEIDSATPLRRSNRLKEKSCDADCSSPKDPLVDEDDSETESGATVGDHDLGISDYESIRNARISENKARMASFGIDRSITELHGLISSDKSKRSHNKRKPDVVTPIRRSDRLKGKTKDLDTPSPQAASEESDDERLGTAKRSLFSSSYRCASKARGSIYDPVLGICCHFCRQKKLCGEEDCKRCGDRDMNQPCIGKTECSVCHSSNGILCRACLKVRYGEEMEEVRRSKNWMCPHCVEEKGIIPYWICNSSFCLKKRKMVPTGIAIYQAREAGYESVAHLIMDKLKRKEYRP